MEPRINALAISLAQFPLGLIGFIGRGAGNDFSQIHTDQSGERARRHERRLLILCLLADGERTVSEIEAIMDMTQAAVSQQLARLRLDGLVTTRRAGRSIYYSTASRDVTRLITSLHQMLKAQPGQAARRGT